jgi:acyl-CoA reductase-like NAD-dependent aldehyde dehydrogenase
MAGEFADGYFIEPTVFAHVSRDAEIANEEVFGPVLSIMKFTDEDDAVALANATAYGLGAYLQTRDVNRVHRVAAALDSGMVWVNGHGGLPPSSQFGGVKQSGNGRIGGFAGIQEFSRVKNVWVSL